MKISFFRLRKSIGHELGYESKFLEAPGNYRARKAVLFSIPDGSFKIFENYSVKLSAKQKKWTSLEVRTHPTFLETSISKQDNGPVNLPGLSRNGPRARPELTGSFEKRASGPDRIGSE